MTVHTPIEARDRGIPRWALGLTLVVFLAGGGYFASNLEGENPPIGGGSASSGGTASTLAIVKRAGCQACHGNDLKGQSTFPSLHGVKDGPISANLAQLGTDHPDDWANIWIAGTDPTVADPAMRGGMPAFGATLTTEEIAAIVEYLKTLP